MKLRFSKPVVVAQGPACTIKGWKAWGPYQFPGLQQMKDGRLVYTFNAGVDSEKAYGTPPGCCVSCDGGLSWVPADVREFQKEPFMHLDNGDDIDFVGWDAIPLEGLNLPEPVGKTTLGHVIYRLDDIAPEVCCHTWQLRRVNKEHPEGIIEDVKVNWPNMVVRSFAGVLIPPEPRGRLRKDNNGVLWMPHYYLGGLHPVTGEFTPYLCNILFRSDDNGHTWDMVNYMEYKPDEAQKRMPNYEGYGENDITFAPDGSLVRLIRTDSVAPCWLVRSTDEGKTWSEPVEFDDHGVWPCIVTLGCGVTLASYGRPGLSVRATKDPSCQTWEAPVEVIHTRPECALPKSEMTMEDVGTCGYSNLLPLDDRTAALVYSNHRIRDEYGVTHKCMMYCTVTVED